MRKTDLGKAFDKFKKQQFVYHRGFRGERQGEWIAFKGGWFLSIESFQQAVDTFIREGGVAIGNSLNRKNK